MKLLLDENLPKRLKSTIPNQTVFTVADMNWNGKKNGELLALLIENNFDALITFDKYIQYQQNFSEYKFPILVLNAKDNTFATLSLFSAKIIDILDKPLLPGIIGICE